MLKYFNKLFLKNLKMILLLADDSKSSSSADPSASNSSAFKGIQIIFFLKYKSEFIIISSREQQARL